MKFDCLKSHYIVNVLKKYGSFDLLELSMPYDYNKKFRPNIGRSIRQLEYLRIIENLMYAMSCTSLDITFSVGMLSNLQANLKRLIRMLFRN